MRIEWAPQMFVVASSKEDYDWDRMCGCLLHISTSSVTDRLQTLDTESNAPVLLEKELPVAGTELEGPRLTSLINNYRSLPP
jgi:hypothetical protein